MCSRLLSLAVVSSLLRGSFAQIVSAVQCSASYAWAFNKLQQSPCLVAAYLDGVCTDGKFTINPLPPGSHYSGPTVAMASPCQCNTVVYCLTSACGDCQGRSVLSWDDWKVNCATAHIRIFPANVPAETLIPDWAYLDVGTYSAEAAQKLLNSNTSATPTSTSTPSSSSKSTPPINKAVLAGSIGGGVFALVLLTIFAFWCYSRRRRRQELDDIIEWPQHDNPSNITPFTMREQYIETSPPMSPPMSPPTSPPTSPTPFLTNYSSMGHGRNVSELSGTSYLGRPEI